LYPIGSSWFNFCQVTDSSCHLIYKSQLEKLLLIQSLFILDFHLAIKQFVLNNNTIFLLFLSWHLHCDNQGVRMIRSFKISLYNLQ
jgi:hypothetical protein